ncbi:MAG: three-Cys-motif partner protein TcmP [Candidatus Micrarchaeota archaeon]
MPKGKRVITGQQEPKLVRRFRQLFSHYKGYMSTLVELGENYSVGFWTPLKLYALASFIHTCYLPIMANLRNGFLKDDLYYVDLLANSGINRVNACRECQEFDQCYKCAKRFKKDKEYYFPGSPLLAATAKTPFKKMYLVEQKRKLCATLEKRLEYLSTQGQCKSSWQIFSENCNSAIDRIIADISLNKKYHVLAFADNAGLNITWETIRKLVELDRCDLVINYPTSGVKRAFGQKATDFELRKLPAFFGCKDIRREYKNEEQLLPAYIQKLESFGKTVISIPVKTDTVFTYNLLVVTKANPGYIKALEAIKETVEFNTARDVERTLDVVLGPQKTMGQYL